MQRATNHHRRIDKEVTKWMNDNDRFYPAVQTPVGKVLLIGATMTVERERELFGKKVKTDERAGTHN